MGEYAKNHRGEEIKIGTCEDMLYLRADQVRDVTAIPNSVDPFRDAEGLRFRFPFPDEDGIEPGAFTDHDRGVAINAELGDGCTFKHSSIQFCANYPKVGLLVSLPCPESAEGRALEASGVRIGKNGYAGNVRIVQQRLVGGRLVLICQCGSCGAAYRLPTLEDARPIVDACIKRAEGENSGRPGNDPARARWWFQIARRIVDGYNGPNAWNPTNTADAGEGV